MGGAVIPGYRVLDTVQEGVDLVLVRSRRDADARPVLIRSPTSSYPSARALEKLEHEFSLRADLDPSWAVMPLELQRSPAWPALILQDPDGAPLDSFRGRAWTLSETLRLGLGVARALSGVHGRNLIHRDINPSNIFYNPDSDDVRLTGFGIASRLPRERQSPDPPQALSGTLAYMAPEQTGRMNRSVDSRSDLYSLGMTLYELLTGVPPFTASDPMGWIHCHVARQPIAPRKFAAAGKSIPDSVSDVVLKLLAKVAEERYQSAEGLAFDLSRCLEQWEAQGRIDAFPLGEHDVSSRLRIPEKLYGRERQSQALLTAFSHVVEQGVSGMVLVSGAPGIGKSSLVNELHKVIVLPRGLFASGKFDPHKRNMPYDTLAQAFGALVRQILAKSQEDAAAWREAISGAVGPNGQVIAEIVPELEFLLGAQPPVPRLSSQEAQNRFHSVFRQFLAAFARKEHPLVLFLDDLQWADTASLTLLEHLISDPEVRHLLLIGAYRDNEVDPSHPLVRTLDAIRRTGVRMEELALGPLSLEDVGRLLNEALQLGDGECESLALLMHRKTAGNPFFTVQFLSALAQEHLLAFDLKAARWRWDVDGIRAKGFSENVVDLMAEKLRKLPPEELQALEVFAFVGDTAERATLALLLGETEEKTDELLWEALRSEFILRVGSAYKFQHDRIREAAYSLVPEAMRAAEHLRIGRLLLEGMKEDAIEEEVFSVVGQFNQALGLISETHEKGAVARLNALAGRKAKASVAYASARDYLAQAMALLPADTWSTEYEETFSVALDLSECEFLIGRFKEANGLFRLLLEKARNNPDRSEVYLLRMRLYQASGRVDKALEEGFQGLGLFGLIFPKSEAEIRDALAEAIRGIVSGLRGRGTAELLAAPPPADADVRAIIALISETCTPAYLMRSNLLSILILKGLDLSFRYGNTPASCTVYSSYALIRSTSLDLPNSDLFRKSLFPQLPSALEISELSLQINARFNDVKRKGMLLFLHGVAVTIWRKPLAITLAILEQAFAAALNGGDPLYAGYNLPWLVWYGVEKGKRLDEIRKETLKYLDFAKQSRNEMVYQVLALERQFITALMGLTLDPLRFEDEGVQEAEALAYLQKTQYGTGIANYALSKQALAFYYGRYDEALHYSLTSESLLIEAMGTLGEFSQIFFHALTLAAVYAEASEAQKKEYAASLARKLETLRLWANDCPENFQHHYVLVAAEVARIKGRDLEAMRLYDEAVQLARDNGFVHIEGLANEFAGRFHLDLGLKTNAQTYLRNARSCYFQWGALGKVKQLDQRYPGLQAPAPMGAMATMNAPQEQLDFLTIIKASQAVSGEIVLETLIEKLLAILVEHAGAERGLLILHRGEAYVVAAEATTAQDRIDVHFRNTRVTSQDLPESVLHFALRTQERVLLDDASVPNLYSEDEYIRRSHPRSILCLPLVKQSKRVALLYLENNLTSGAFTPDRIAVLEILASQAAISLENAELYSHLQDNQARLSAIIRQMPSGLAIAEAPGGRLVTGNDQLERILRQPFRASGAIENYTDYTGFHPDGRLYEPEEWPLARSIRNGEIIQDEEAEILRGDGSRCSISLSSAPIRDSQGRITAGVVMIVDITERKHAEERFSKAFHDNPTPMGIVRLNSGLWVDANESLLKTFEYDRGEIIGRTSLENGIIDAEQYETMHRTLAAKGTTRDLELKLRTKSGRLRSVLTSIGIIELGGEKCILGSFVDMTERQQVEEQLRQSQKMEAIGRLAGGVAHDFNNLLTAINGYSTMVLEEMDAADPHFDSVREILKAGERASGLTKQLLAYSRKQVLQSKQWNLNSIVEELEPMLRRLIGEDVRLISTLPRDVALVTVDRSQVEQILLNLAINARDAMPNGGDLTFETRNIDLERKERDNYLEVSPGPYVMLAVSDTGTGMPPEVKAKLFEPFFTTKAEGKGTGLGLSVVYGIVKQSGGTLSASSEPGKGSTFRLYFPRTAPRDLVSPEPTSREDSEAFRGTEVILLVEDDFSVRKFTRHVLESRGYRVLEAGNGQEALQVLRATALPIELVITDIVMPDMGGVALAAMIQKLYVDIPVLYVSGYTETMVSGDRFLPKPFSPFQLTSKVREILDRKREAARRAGEYHPA